MLFTKKFKTILTPIVSLAVLSTFMVFPMAVMASTGTTVSISPVSQAVANGGTFDISLIIDTETASRGWQATVNYDTTKLTANSYTQGGFLKDWATANGDNTSDQSQGINATAGTINLTYIVTGTANLGGPGGSGTLCTISFTAKQDVNTVTDITLSNVVVSDVNAAHIPGVVSHDATVTVGNIPMTDLVVSSASTTRVDSTTYIISYTITNNGNLAADASMSSVVIDAGAPITAAIPALAAGASATITTGTQTISGSDDSIVITADSGSAITESNETNNSRTITYALVSDNGDTPISGNISTVLEFTAPEGIGQWNMVVGANNLTGVMNVKCNSSWQVQVSDAYNSGYMTKWTQASGFVSGIHLADRLQVGSITSCVLSGNPQIIAIGDASGQNGDNGQNLTVYYGQTVHYTDPVLTGGYSYYVVVTFAASVTI